MQDTCDQGKTSKEGCPYIMAFQEPQNWLPPKDYGQPETVTLARYASEIRVFTFTPMGVNLISSGSPHVRPMRAHMGVHRACGA